MKADDKKKTKGVEPRKKKETRPTKSGRPTRDSLPPLVEMVLSLSILVVVLIVAAVVIVSINSGATLTDIILRASVSTVVIGAVMLLLAQTVSNGVINATREKLNAEAQPIERNKKPESTIEA